jgi:hypothetical protein
MRKIFQKAKNMLKINSRNYKILVALSSIAVTAVVGYFITQAGSFTPPGAPTMVGGSQMKTLDQIYCKLMKSDISCNPMTPNVDSPGSPAATMHTLQEIYDATPDFRNSPGDAMSGDCTGGVCVKTGKTFYTDSKDIQTGTAQCVQAIAPDASTIKAGNTICGVEGSYLAFPEVTVACATTKNWYSINAPGTYTWSTEGCSPYNPVKVVVGSDKTIQCMGYLSAAMAWYNLLCMVR